MGIGLSNGAFYRDEGHFQASQWDDRYDDNVITPRQMETNKGLEKSEIDNLGLEVKDQMPFPNNRNPDQDFNSRFGNLPPSGILNDLKKPTGETIPLVRRINDDTDYGAAGYRAIIGDAKPDGSNAVERTIDRLFGLNGRERYKLWPERMLDSAQNAAGDVMSGKVPGWQYDENTGEFHTSMEMIEKANDLAALGISGNIPFRVRLREPANASEFSFTPSRSLNEKSQDLDAIDRLIRNAQARRENGDLPSWISQEEVDLLNSSYQSYRDLSKGKLSEKFGEGDISVSRNSDQVLARHEFTFNDAKSGGGGQLHISEMNNGKMLYVDWVGDWGSVNKLGPKGTRDLLRALAKEFPEAEEIAGFRVSGARARSNSTGPARMKLPKFEEKT